MKVHSRLYCLKTFGSFDGREEILQMFYPSTVSRFFTFGLACWVGKACKQDQNRFDKSFKKAGGVVGRRQGIADTVYHRLVTNKMWRVSDDITDTVYHRLVANRMWRVSDDITDTVYHRLVTNRMWRVSDDIITDTVYHRLVTNKMTH